MERADLDLLRDYLLAVPSGGAPELLLSRVAERLVEAGFPLWRVASALHTLDPEEMGLHLVWVRGEGGSGILRPHSLRQTASWVGTPVEAVVDLGVDELRLRLDDEETLARWPILRELRAAGGTDYWVCALDTAEGLTATTAHPYWRRAFLSVATDAPSGFSDSQVSTLHALRPAFALRIALEASKHASRSLLRAYLGQNASRRILAGDFRRGGGEELDAAIWYCDMRGFTLLSDALPAAEVVRTLDGYFDCLASPVDARGGEVLKFIGDAVLAVFPLGNSPREACGRAVAAAREGCENLRALNSARRASGQGELGVGIALHVGRVLYGNIGARGRLDFTVIGAKVNEACRVEALTRALGVEVLLTGDFLRASGLAARSLGAHALKGVSQPLEVFTLPEGR